MHRQPFAHGYFFVDQAKNHLPSQQAPPFVSCAFRRFDGRKLVFLYEAYAQIGVSIASLLYDCGPVIVMVLSPALFKEKLTKAKVAGFLAAICGTILVNAHAQGAGGSKWGFVCGGLSAAMVMLNKKAKSIAGLENATVQLHCRCAVRRVQTRLCHSNRRHLRR